MSYIEHSKKNMNQLLSALCPAFFALTMAKTKRVRLTNEVKLKVIERVSEKRSHRQVAEEFGISRTQATRSPVENGS